MKVTVESSGLSASDGYFKEFCAKVMHFLPRLKVELLGFGSDEVVEFCSLCESKMPSNEVVVHCDIYVQTGSPQHKFLLAIVERIGSLGRNCVLKIGSNPLAPKWL